MKQAQFNKLSKEVQKEYLERGGKVEPDREYRSNYMRWSFSISRAKPGQPQTKKPKPKKKKPNKSKAKQNLRGRKSVKGLLRHIGVKNFVDIYRLPISKESKKFLKDIYNLPIKRLTKKQGTYFFSIIRKIEPNYKNI